MLIYKIPSEGILQNLIYKNPFEGFLFFIYMKLSSLNYTGHSQLCIIHIWESKATINTWILYRNLHAHLQMGKDNGFAKRKISFKLDYNIFI